MREQAELETKLAALKRAAREATSCLATAEADCKRLQEGQAQPAQVPAVPLRVHNAHAGYTHDGPVTVTVEEADKVQVVLDGMLGKIPPQLFDAFVFAVNRTFVKPPGALPPASRGRAVHAAVNEDEVAAAEEADASTTAAGVAGKRSGKSDADPY